MMDSKVMPVSGYMKAGTFNYDCKPGSNFRPEKSRSIGKNEGYDFGSGKVTYASKSGKDTSANFTRDADMDLKKNYGK